MAGHSVPVDFWIEPQKIENPGERDMIMEGLINIIESHSGKLHKASEVEIPGGHHFVYASEMMTLTVKMYLIGLVSCMVEYFMPEKLINEHKIVNDDGRNIENAICTKLNVSRAKVLPALKRGPPVNPYYTSSDDRILEYDTDKLLFNIQSPYQRVQIIHTLSFGNLLFLDDLQNLSESDLSYTHGLMNYSQENYEGKEILILGGGDGALLWELLKQNPKFVTMIDIDEIVLQACRKYMRSVCGTCLDSYNGENYKIIIGDAIQHMKEYIKEGRRFDYVFGDLTDVPISENPIGDQWDFMRTIINLGTHCTKPFTGKYMSHAIGIGCESALTMFEEQIKNLEVPVTFERTSAFVPSFMEKWCFYQMTPQPLV